MFTKLEKYSAYYYTTLDKQLTFTNERLKPVNSFLKNDSWFQKNQRLLNENNDIFENVGLPDLRLGPGQLYHRLSLRRKFND